jgi:impB/mucB/samB family C-terminal domain
MSYVCLWSPSWPTGAGFPAELIADLLVHAPRVSVGAQGRVWADARGLDAHALAVALLDVAQRHGFANVRAGAATTAIAAELAATRSDAPVPFTVVAPGHDRAFVAPFPVDVLAPSTLLANALDGIGVETLGALAALDASHVETRMGAEGVRLWKLARADDPRLLFACPDRQLPSTTVEWVDYALRDAGRLLFVVNAQATTVCDALVADGQRARELALVFALADRTDLTQRVRSARPTASQQAWMRLIRSALERVTLPDAVTAVTLRVESAIGNDGVQGDLFDKGFASAPQVERTVSQLMDDQGDVVLTPRNSAHPLVDVRTAWTREDPAVAARSGERGVAKAQSGAKPTPRLTLQLVTPPRAVAVKTAARRDHLVPVQYRDGGTSYVIVDVAGPERVSGGQWEEGGPYAREYFRCVREDGMLVWLYRDAATAGLSVCPSAWYFHGWWD